MRKTDHPETGRTSEPEISEQNRATPQREPLFGSDDSVTRDSPPPREAPRLPKGTEVGRYMLLDALGEGGMGVVYAAWDEELKRRVAIKLLRSSVSGSEQSASAGRARLLREAQALAQLSHPNVVTVHDVGTYGDSVFMAMELVDGVTMRQWLRERRSAKEILSVLRDAGAGLAAAHAIGLIHRDFKPDNVLIGGNGRVYVTDFGLARTRADGEETSAPEPSSPLPHSLQTPLTQAGAVVGTSPYMAPELFQGSAADAKTDQFAFCVTFYEALFGLRPFLRVPQGQADRWTLQPAPEDRRAPGWLKRLVLRGLELAPAARHPDLQSILEVLRDPPTDKWRRRALSATALAGVAAMIAFGNEVVQKRSRLCRIQDSALSGAFDSAIAARLQAAFIATGHPFAKETWASTQSVLSRYAQALVQARQETCEATRVSGVQSEEVLGLRMACLDRRITGLRALTDVYAEPTRPMLDQAVRAASSLTPIASCSNVAALRAPTKLPEDASLRERVEKLRGQLARTKALSDSARYTDALPLAESVAKDAQATGYRPLEAESLQLLAQVQMILGKLDDSQATLRQALLASTAGNSAESAALASIGLVRIAYLQQKPELSAQWRPFAQATIEAQGGNLVQEAMLLLNESAMSYAAQKYELAHEQLQKVVAMRLKLYGPTHPEVARVQHNLGLVLMQLHRPADAVAQFVRARETLLASNGPGHPETQAVSEMLGGLYLNGAGSVEAALSLLETSFEARRKVLGMEHSSTARSLGSLGNAHLLQGRYLEAEKEFAESLALLEKHAPPTDPWLLDEMANLASTQMTNGKLEAALAGFEREVRVSKPDANSRRYLAQGLMGVANVRMLQGRMEEALGYLRQSLELLASHPDLPREIEADARQQLAAVYLKLKKPRQAVEELEKALALNETLLLPESPKLAEVRVDLAGALLAVGDHAKAQEQMTAAFPLYERNAGWAKDFRARAEFTLARALQAAGDGARALKLAESAAANLAASERPNAPELAELAPWLKTHRSP